MKQLFTLALAAATAISAAAITPGRQMQVSQKIANAQAEAVQPQKAPLKLSSAAFQSSKALKSAIPVKASSQAMAKTKADGDDASAAPIEVGYTLPTPTYAQKFSYDRTTAEEGTYTNSFDAQQNLQPPYQEVQFLNITNDGSSFIQDGFSWANPNGKVLGTERNLTVPTTSTLYFDYVTYDQCSPVLNYADTSYTNGLESDGSVYPWYFTQGGNVNEADSTCAGLLSNFQSQGVTAVYNDGVWMSSPFLSYFNTYSHMGDQIADDSTLVADFGSELGLTDPHLYGVAQYIDNGGAPIALSFVAMDVYIITNGPVSFTGSLYDMTTGQNVANASCTLTEALPEPQPGYVNFKTLRFDYTSLPDGAVDPVPFITSEHPLLFILTGYMGNSAIDWFTPIYAFYNWTPNRVSPINEHNEYYVFNDAAGNLAWAANTYGYYADAAHTKIMSPYGFRSNIGLEFPYLRPTTTWINGGDAQELENADAYNVTLDTDSAKVQFEIDTDAAAYPGFAADDGTGDINLGYLQLSFLNDDDEMPDWLGISIASGDQMTDSSKGYRFMELLFYLNEGYTAAPEDLSVVLSYKGLQKVFNISGQAGINNVERDAAADVVASRYFDLQGRELSNAPADGLFIRRDLRANGSSTVQKIAR